MSRPVPSTRESARKDLVESHLALVRSVARRFAGQGEALDDLVQVGSIGLIKASDRFDPSRGVSFATFATPSIEGEIRHHLRDRVSSLRIPRDLQRKSGELHQRRGELAAELGRSPTVKELATSLDADELDVERVLSADRARESISISAGGEGVEVPDDSKSLAGSDDRLLLAGSMRTLSDRERRIVLLRFHADMTERDIADELGISQAHVSRLLGRALTKLRADLSTPEEDAEPSDITPDEVISPASETNSTGQKPRGRRSAGPGERKRARRRTRIRHVGGSPESRTLEEYLELPYRVAVNSEQEGGRERWSASVVELSGCKALGATPDDAVKRLRPAMEAWLTSALAEQREIPVPAPVPPKAKGASRHSGRFLVRMPSELHEQLAQAAERNDVSLNRFVTDVLAASVADPTGTLAPPTATPADAAVTEVIAPEPTAPEPAEITEGARPARGLRVAVVTNLAVVVCAGLVAVALLILALERGI